MANISNRLLDELDGRNPMHGLTDHDDLLSAVGRSDLHSVASLSLFHQSNPADDVMRCVHDPALSTSPSIQRSLSVDSCACTMCHQVFNSSSARATHVQMVHAGQKPFECTTCGKCFANSSYLSQHNRIHLGVKPYRCQLCDRRFTQLCHLQQHIRTHTGEKPYRCGHAGCTKAFSQLSNLQSHTRSHMTDKPFRCNSCYKCFADERSLQEHIPKHTETKHLKTKICTICGKSYAQETYLARHMAKHETSGDVRRPLLRQHSEGSGVGGIFANASNSLQDYHPSGLLPRGLLGNVPCVLPSFPAFRGGMAQCSTTGVSKIPGMLTGVGSPSAEMSVARGMQGLDLLPYSTQQGRNSEPSLH